jgi:hypothetical protein
MEIVQILQQLAPATVTVALLTLPWAALAALHAFGAVSRDRHDDNWSVRASAAVRWVGAVAEPVQRQAIALRRITAVRASGRCDQGRVFLPHAA